MSWTLEAERALGSDRRIRRWRWPSGLALVTVHDASAPVVSYQTWFGVGSRHEQPGQTGMAHLFEHLMFNRTTRYAQGELDRLIERTGGDTNAATWVDWTHYRDSVPARDFELAVQLEADRMVNLVLDDEQIESEREVVANERLEHVDDDVDGFLEERLMALAFTRHPYRWPTIGWMEDIRALARPEIRRFYDTWYAPNAATLVVVGAVPEATVKETVARYYGDLAPAPLPDQPAAIEPEQTEERRAEYPWPLFGERLVAGYKAPAQSDPDWAALDLAAAVLAGGPSARLWRRLVIERELATMVDCGVAPFRDPSLFRVGVAVNRGADAAEALAEIEEAIARLAAEPVPDRELARVKNGVETDFWSSLSDADGIAEALGHYEVTQGSFEALFELADRFTTVTADDVRRVCTSYLRRERRTVVTAVPEASA